MTTPAKVPKKRVAKIAAPGAVRVTLRGIMAVPDDFGRVRVLLVDALPDGTPDHSAAALQRIIPERKHMSVPYRLATPGRSQYDDGVLGEFWAVIPKRFAQHWAAVAAELRGLPVSVEATLRPFAMAIQGADDFDTAEITSSGISLDVALIEALPSRVGGRAVALSANVTS